MVKRLVTVLFMLFVLFQALPMAAQERDEEMINASLRFIKEKANLSKKEYQKFAKIYIEYNEQLAKLNRELKPDNPDYMKRWNLVNDDYTGKLAKELEDSTRTKIGIAQFELGQKIWKQWYDRNQHEMDMQTQMWMRSAQMNRQFMMMQPQIMDARRRQMQNMENVSQQQRQWWENYWKNWQRPDSIPAIQPHRPIGVLPMQSSPRYLQRSKQDSTTFMPQRIMRPGTGMRTPAAPSPYRRPVWENLPRQWQWGTERFQRPGTN